jgi:hypothetical protein
VSKTAAVLKSEIIEVDDDPEALYELSLKEGWGDGVPLLPPTDERVHAMLAATPLDADHVLGSLPPKYVDARVETVAINAAMAGCEARAFPYVIAALEAILQPEFNAYGILTTTSGVFPMLIVNGPAREELGINYQAGALGGGGGRGSMTIGRAVALSLRNIGGQKAGETSRCVLGQPARFGMCFGEWDEREPWKTLAERRGFRKDQEVVTVHAGKGVAAGADVYNDDPRDLASIMGHSIAHPMANHFLEHTGSAGQVIVVINPIWADRMKATFPTVESLQQCLWENAWQPIEIWGERNQGKLREWNRVDSKGRVRMVERPDQLVPIVCGGLGSLHTIALHSWVQSEMQSVAIKRS